MKAQGEFAQVREVIEKAIRVSGQPVKRGSMAHEHELYTILADTAAEMRDIDGLAQYARHAEDLAIRDGHKLYLGIAYRARGVEQRLGGDYETARDRFEAAKQLFEALETSWQLGRTLFELAELDEQIGDRKAARQNFLLAQKLFAGLQAQPFVDKVQFALDKSGGV